MIAPSVQEMSRSAAYAAIALAASGEPLVRFTSRHITTTLLAVTASVTSCARPDNTDYEAWVARTAG